MGLGRCTWKQKHLHSPLHQYENRRVQKYVLGVAVTRESVVLVKKNRPSWQAGLYNFPGGKVEPGEKPVDAMVREFFEETSVRIPKKSWKKIGKMERTGDFSLTMFVTSHDDVENAHTVTDEEIHFWRHKALIEPDNAPFLISNVPIIFQHVMSMDFLGQGAQLIIKYPPLENAV